MSDQKRRHRQHPDAGHDSAHSHTSGPRPRNRAAIVGFAAIVLLVVLVLLFLGGDDTQSPETVGTETTDVIEPGSADDGPDGDVSLQENQAGTDADPAIDDSPATDD